MNAKKAKALRLMARQLQAVTEGNKEWNDVEMRQTTRNPEKLRDDLMAQGYTMEDVLGHVRYAGREAVFTSDIRMHKPDSGRGIYKALKKQGV